MIWVVCYNKVTAIWAPKKNCQLAPPPPPPHILQVHTEESFKNSQTFLTSQTSLKMQNPSIMPTISYGKATQRYATLPHI